MYDANQESTDKVELKLDVKGDTEAVISYVPDEIWLKDAKRKYPVVVDPPVLTNQSDVTQIMDTFVSSIDPEDKWLNMFLRVGKHNDNTGQMRTYIKVPLPKLDAGDQVVYSELRLQSQAAYSAGSCKVTANQVTSDFINPNFQGMGWANKPLIDFTPLDQKQIGKVNDWQNFDITYAAKDWYINGNKGICLTADGDATGNGNYIAFISSDVSGAYESS